jgi:hypothetical protein
MSEKLTAAAAALKIGVDLPELTAVLEVGDLFDADWMLDADDLPKLTKALKSIGVDAKAVAGSGIDFDLLTALLYVHDDDALANLAAAGAIPQDIGIDDIPDVIKVLDVQGVSHDLRGNERALLHDWRGILELAQIRIREDLAAGRDSTWAQ